MKLVHIRWWTVLLGVVALEAAMIIAAVLWVVVYSYVIHPGEQAPFYEAHAQTSSPVVSVFAGIPVFYLAGRWIRRRRATGAVETALALGCAVVVLDLALLAFGKPGLYLWLLALLSWTTKIIAIYFGARPAGEAVAA